MIARLVNAFLIGLAFVAILDFLFFIGLKINYFDFYVIKEYFNVLFIDNQNFYILLPLSLLVGYLVLYSGFSKIFIRFYLICIFLSAATIYEPIGLMAGEKIFLKENLRLKLGTTVFSADLLYSSRVYVYLYRKDLSKTIKLKRDEVTILTPW
jgi:hypothetical protein